MNKKREYFEKFVRAKYGGNTLIKSNGEYADRVTEKMFQAYNAAFNSGYKHGARIYIDGSEMFVGLFVGINPSTGSVVCFNEKSGEYRSFHQWQVYTK